MTKVALIGFVMLAKPQEPVQLELFTNIIKLMLFAGFAGIVMMTVVAYVISQRIVIPKKWQSMFLALVSHELKSPLTSIKGWSVTLASDPSLDKDQWSEGLELIRAECDRLSEMVDQMLDLSYYDGGIQSITRLETDVGEMVTDVVRQFRPRLDSAMISLHWIEPRPLLFAMLDVQRIRQVLINLIDNAIKFTPAGGHITISVRETGKFLLLVVEDSGCGIAKEALSRVTERFYKGDMSLKGAGLGLAICSEIIKLHHGQLKIESELGHGTRLSVILPRER